MKNTLKVNHADRVITMDRTFAKNAENTMSAEYAHLQSVRRDYPTYTVVRRQIKPNPNKERYKGLTYAYMRRYIITHEEGEEQKAVLAEFEEMLLRSECHSRCHRYPTIKNWFLAKYPEIAKFGMPADTAEFAEEESDAQSNKIIPMPQKNEEIPAVVNQ